jgi:hypothetical protein
LAPISLGLIEMAFDNNKVEVRLPSFGKVSESVNKLIEAISAAVGNAFDAEAIKARAEARGIALVTKTKAEIEALALWEKAQDRLRRKEERRQKNIESITIKAIPFLPEMIDEQKPNDDWICQFFEHAQDVGDDEMQTIWSKLLAGEVSTPGKYSLLTLAKLRTMSPREANLFTELATCVWYFNEECEINLITDLYDLETKNIYSYASMEAIFLLDLHGLVQYQPTMGYPIEQIISVNYFGHKFRLDFQSYMGGFHDHLSTRASLTQVGKELLNIAGGKPDLDYMKTIFAEIEAKAPVKITEDDE